MDDQSSETAACHHSPGSVQFANEACVVHIADILAHACGHEATLVNEVPPLQRKAWDAVGLTSDQLAATIRQVEGEFKQIITVFLVRMPARHVKMTRFTPAQYSPVTVLVPN